MSLTVREKEHWKERIARRIDHAIEQLLADDDADFDTRIEKEAEEKAWESLGLKERREESASLDREIETLKARQRDVRTEMHVQVGGSKHRCAGFEYNMPSNVTEAIRRRAIVHKRDLLALTPLGQKILRLQQEKEELLDTVWLATSPTQIKELWSRFAELLNWEPPKLQQDALAIEPLPHQE